MEEKILIGFFMCENTSSDFLGALKPAWNNEVTMPPEQKLEVVTGNYQDEIENIFPFKDELSGGINAGKFCLSFLRQPKLFIRIRPGFDKKILQKLQEHGIKYEAITKNCIAFANASKIDEFIHLDREAVVQDYNSQRVGEFLKLILVSDGHKINSPLNVWDCCAASGGKSILAYDIDPRICLTVSDKRQSILQNLKQRFQKAGIKNYRSLVADLSGDQVTFGGTEIGSINKTYDVIIADVPCTGSGTWARTPEQLYYFDHKQIKKYADLQKQIVENVIHYLNPEGYLLYITCSVFKKENEEVVNFIKEKLKIKLIKMKLLNGYEMRADTMFAALFKLRP